MGKFGTLLLYQQMWDVIGGPLMPRLEGSIVVCVSGVVYTGVHACHVGFAFMFTKFIL